MSVPDAAPRPPCSVRAAIEQERQRIARELHAGAGQPLSGIHIYLEMVEEYMRTPTTQNRAAAEEAVRRLRKLATEASGQVRALSHRLHPPEWQRLPAADAIRQLIDSSGLNQKFTMDLRIGNLPSELSHETSIALYRCAQECIANTIRHSQANRVQFDLHADRASVYLSLVDNGRGFRPSVCSDGLGLRAMLKQAEELGGECNIQSGEDGSRIEIRLPLSPCSQED